jgi:hypothetical protein
VCQKLFIPPKVMPRALRPSRRFLESGTKRGLVRLSCVLECGRPEIRLHSGVPTTESPMRRQPRSGHQCLTAMSEYLRPRHSSHGFACCRGKGGLKSHFGNDRVRVGLGQRGSSTSSTLTGAVSRGLIAGLFGFFGSLASISDKTRKSTTSDIERTSTGVPATCLLVKMKYRAVK